MEESIVASYYLMTPLRSLNQYLADLQDEYDRLPMQSARRGRLVVLIRECEIAIDERSGT